MFKRVIASLVVASISPSVFAHITLENQEAVSGATYRATLQVPHGCAGSPTIGIRVRIPDGVREVKAQPKAGWKLTTTKTRLAKPLDDGHGGLIREAVTEIAWTGGRLLDENFDLFMMRMALPDSPGSTIYFPVVQQCEKGVTRWIEIPQATQTRDDLKEPAPQVRLLSKPR